MTRQQKKDSLIAGLITLLALCLLVVTLVFGHISYEDRLALNPEPEIGLISDEEEFIEPELLRELGEPDAVSKDAPAPAVKGDPKPDEVDNTQKIVPGKNPKQAPAQERKVTSKKKQEVKADEPTLTDKEKKDVASRMSKFGGKNGITDGKNGSKGAGGVSTGVNGVASGRVFKGCPKPQVSLRHKVTVTVAVTINADGNVIDAHARGGASADIRRACEAAARAAKWSTKPDAPTTKGTITFTITPV